MDEPSETTEPLQGDVAKPLISLRVRVVVGVLLLGGLVALAVSGPQKQRSTLKGCLKEIDAASQRWALETKESEANK